MAGIVHRKLFPQQSINDIERISRENYDDIIRIIKSKIESQSSSEKVSGDDINMFEPFESKYLSNATMVSNDEENPHLTYIGKLPNFIEREKKKAENQRSDGVGTKRSFALLGQIKDDKAALSGLFSSARRPFDASTRPSGSLLSSLNGFSSKPRTSVTAIRLNQIQQVQESRNREEALEKQAQAQAKKKGKVDLTKGSSSSSTATAAIKPTAAAPTMNTLDVKALFEQSPLLSDEDKIIIESFFKNDGSFLINRPTSSSSTFRAQRRYSACLVD